MQLVDFSPLAGLHVHVCASRVLCQKKQKTPTENVQNLCTHSEHMHILTLVTGVPKYCLSLTYSQSVEG